MATFEPVLSYGFGVESTAILLRWLEEPETRDFDVSRLIVVSAHTGDEWPDTRDLVETHVLPRLRAHGVRFVQLGRVGHLEKDGIIVLEDSREPAHFYCDGSYKLSQELLASGTVPQFGGEHRCSLKFKAWVIETWLQDNLFDEAIRHSFGYNVDEGKRITKSDAAIAARVSFGFGLDELKRVAKGKAYDRPNRIGHYPLVEWGWGREECLAYILRVTGVLWRKSACKYCPFARISPEMLARQRQFPAQTAESMMLEHVSLAMNPRGQLYKREPLYQIVTESGNHAATEDFRSLVAEAEFAGYRVRRVYKAKGKARRCVEKIETFTTRPAADEWLIKIALDRQLKTRMQHGISYAYVRERGSSYPTREDYYVVAPGVVETKARYGVARFDQQWAGMADLYCGQDDLPLFAGVAS